MSRDVDISKKIQLLREQYIDFDSQKRIDGLEKTLRRNIIQAKLGENDTVKEIIDAAKKNIRDIDTLLATDEDLTTEERKGLFREKKVHFFYLARFDSEVAQKTLDMLEEGINKRLDI